MLVYKIPYRRARTWPSGCEQRNLAYNLYARYLSSRAHSAKRARDGRVSFVCKIPLLARRTRPMQPIGQARRATIGYLVCIQDTLSSRAAPLGRVRRASKGILHISILYTRVSCIQIPSKCYLFLNELLMLLI